MTSRRVRKKKGNSFLEDVKADLGFITDEIARLRTLLQEFLVQKAATGCEEVFLPPPAPPPLDVLDRNLLLRHRLKCEKDENRELSLMRTLSVAEIAAFTTCDVATSPAVDEIETSLQMQGHFELGGEYEKYDDDIVDGLLSNLQGKTSSAHRTAEYRYGNDISNTLGTPAMVLKKQCKAVYRIQKIWATCKSKLRTSSRSASTSDSPGHNFQGGPLYRNWAPSTSDIFERNSALGIELASEAASCIQKAFRTVSSRLAEPPPGCADHDLHEIVLPLAEWRLATGMRSLPEDAIYSVWAGESRGVRDFDLGLWFRVGTSSTAQISNIPYWDQSTVQNWWVDSMSKAEAQCSFRDRISFLIQEWSQTRSRISPEARPILSKALFSHVDFLRGYLHDCGSDDKG